MKLRFVFLMLLSCSVALAQQKVSSTVDRRVELFSIIFRLAGNPEYNMKMDKNYVADIGTYFNKYNNEPVISFARQLASDKNMGFSKVMFLAVAVEYKNNRFSFIKTSQNNLSGKWDRGDALKFVELANDFYKASAFETFFNTHQQNYAEATAQFDSSVSEFDQNWYLDYYGEHAIDYRVVLGLGDGGANYGPSIMPVNQKKLVYAIMGSWTFAEGKPLFPKEVYLPYLIHEFNHSFIDHLLDEPKLEQQLKASGETLLQAQKEPMRLEGYEDWHSLINESLVRASVVRYMIDHHYSDEAVQEEVAKQTGKGFLWTKDLVALLGEYESSRSMYPTFQSFYPRISSFFDKTARQSGQSK